MCNNGSRYKRAKAHGAGSARSGQWCYRIGLPTLAGGGGVQPARPRIDRIPVAPATDSTVQKYDQQRRGGYHCQSCCNG
jgi:hypothetical protein